MLAGGIMFFGGGDCSSVEVILARPDINGDGIADKVVESRCRDEADKPTGNFWVHIKNANGKDVDLSYYVPDASDGTRRFTFDYWTERSAANWFSSSGFHIGDGVELPNGELGRIHEFLFDVDASGRVEQSLARFVGINYSSSGSYYGGGDLLPVSALKMVSSRWDLMPKAAQIVREVQRQFAKKEAERGRLLAIANLHDLKEPYRTAVLEIEAKMLKTARALVKREILDEVGQDIVLDEVEKRLSISRQAVVMASR